MAFIMALAKIAAGGELLEMPLFMDTPFGRLSFDHRCSLIDNIPDLCAQWILLATDTELRQPEARRLLGTGRWGVFYQLKASETGETTIDKKNPEAAIRSLKRAIERKE
jgi:DNA sulfur modification protein DndD